MPTRDASRRRSSRPHPAWKTEALDLADGGYAWFELASATPERQRTFEEAKAAVKKSYLESEKRKAIEASAAAQVERVKGGESMAAVAKALGAKLDRAEGLKRGPTPPGFTPIAFGEIFALQKGGVSSSASADGKSRTIYRVAEVTPAGMPTKEQITALGGRPDEAAQDRRSRAICRRTADALRFLREREGACASDGSTVDGAGGTHGSRRLTARAGRAMTKIDIGAGGLLLEPDLARFTQRYSAGASQVVWTRLVADLETPVSAMLKLSDGGR